MDQTHVGGDEGRWGSYSGNKVHQKSSYKLNERKFSKENSLSLFYEINKIKNNYNIYCNGLYRGKDVICKLGIVGQVSVVRWTHGGHGVGRDPEIQEFQQT